ncbi:hypothetical protein NFI96_007961 [Prochilodus magdalenae]|nr:hypothetical protein NFI96_007961 [Prochilodus magdalenae]
MNGSYGDGEIHNGIDYPSEPYDEERYRSYEDNILKVPKAIQTASSFFLISSLCVAVPTLVWSLRCLYVCWRSGGRVSVFTIVLLLNVLLQSAFSPPWIMMNLDIPCRSGACDWTLTLVATTDLCGLYLHQLVALESVLSLRYPLLTADLFSRPCSITLSVALYLLCFACVVSYRYAGSSFNTALSTKMVIELRVSRFATVRMCLCWVPCSKSTRIRKHGAERADSQNSLSYSHQPKLDSKNRLFRNRVLISGLRVLVVMVICEDRSDVRRRLNTVVWFKSSPS